MQDHDKDVVIDEIREIRHRISCESQHDPRRLVARYIQLQEQYRDRLIKEVRNSSKAPNPAA
jgi:hypothetical protein